MSANSTKKVMIPLISLFIFVISNGFFMTYISLFLHEAGYPTAIVGMMTAAYYAGLAVASLCIENTITKVGHIRAFSALVSGLAVVTFITRDMGQCWFLASHAFLSRLFYCWIICGG